ncbi:cytochrome P450-dit2 [Ceratobasidium sp. 423]|nr:cytochrome P450-dit2 [Ceratobasidium sp. 423]
MIAEDMKVAIIKDLGGAQSKEFDMLRWCSATALELIGTADTLLHRVCTRIRLTATRSHVIKNHFPARAQIAPFQALFPLIYRMGPSWLQHKLAGWAPNANIRKIKDIIDVQDKQRLVTQAQQILIHKKAALKDRQAPEETHDMMSILLKANMEANEEDRLPEEQLLGQMNTLIFAGHETSSGALTRTLQLLDSHTAIQDRLRAELQAAPEVLAYDELNTLPYLDALCREVLRLYPPAPFMERVALRDWVVPLKYPVKGRDGTIMSEINVRKGTKVYVGIRQANRCKETWGDDADEFKPERWLGELPKSVTDAKTPGVYSSMMTFSGGPRSCIGFKFSILELKILLPTLIKSFKFAPGTTEIVWLSCAAMIPFPAGPVTPLKKV